MAEHVFVSEQVEEFYNSCHNKSDGRFCNTRAKGKGVSRVPMSDAARRSNAVLRRIAAARRSEGYKKTRKAIQGMNKRTNNDKSEPLRGKYKITGNKAQDAINITRLDRGSPQRRAAVAAFEKKYGKKAA